MAWELSKDAQGHTCFLAMYDPGNAAYAGFMHILFAREEVMQMFNGNSDPAAELLGDCVELACGLLHVALRFPEMFPEWGNRNDTLASLRGIERSFHRFAAAEAIVLAAISNRKRRRPRILKDIAELIPDEYEVVPLEPNVDSPGEASVRDSQERSTEQPEGHGAAPAAAVSVLLHGEEPEGEQTIDAEDEHDVVRNAHVQEFKATLLAALKTLRLREGSCEERMCIACGSDQHSYQECGRDAQAISHLQEAFSVIESAVADFPMPRPLTPPEADVPAEPEAPEVIPDDDDDEEMRSSSTSSRAHPKARARPARRWAQPMSNVPQTSVDVVYGRSRSCIEIVEALEGRDWVGPGGRTEHLADRPRSHETSCKHIVENVGGGRLVCLSYARDTAPSDLRGRSSL